MFCNNCGAQLPDGSNFCHQCGNAISVQTSQPQSQLAQPPKLVKVCPKCGDILVENAVFCPACKTKVKKAPLIDKTNMVDLQQAQHAAKNPTLRESPKWLETAPVYQTKKQQARTRIAENKKNGVAGCPKCGSTSLSANKKGFGIGKAVVGAGLAGPFGLVAGNAGAKKVWVTCLNCGNRWKV